MMKKYEFSYVDNNKEMHFVTVFDDDLVSACERVLCRPVSVKEISVNGKPNNFFIHGWTDTQFAIHELAYDPSSHVIYTPEKFNPILAGLV